MTTTDTRTPLVQIPSHLWGVRLEREAVQAVASAFLITRLLLFLVIFLSSATLPMRPGGYLYASPSNLLLDGLVRYDSWWYHNIITQGYNIGNIETGAQGNVAFFPLYPLLVKVTAGLTGNVFVAGILVSNLAFLVALYYLYRLARDEFDSATAGRMVFYLAAAPTALFFSAMYTESLFVALIAATFSYARNSQWQYAAVVGMLAAATRNTGILAAGVIALEGMHQAGVRFWPPAWSRAALVDYASQQVRRTLVAWPALLAALWVPAGLVSYMVYLGICFGDPLAFIHVQATWGREVSAAGFVQLWGNTLQALNIGPNLLVGQVNTQVLLDTLATLAFVPLVVAVVWKLRPAYALFAGLTFLIPLSTGTTGSMTRYILMLIPCWLLLAHWGWRPWVDRLVVGIGLPLMAYFAILFSHWYFAG